MSQVNKPSDAPPLPSPSAPPLPPPSSQPPPPPASHPPMQASLRVRPVNLLLGLVFCALGAWILLVWIPERDPTRWESFGDVLRAAANDVSLLSAEQVKFWQITGWVLIVLGVYGLSVGSFKRDPLRWCPRCDFQVVARRKFFRGMRCIRCGGRTRR